MSVPKLAIEASSSLDAVKAYCIQHINLTAAKRFSSATVTDPGGSGLDVSASVNSQVTLVQWYLQRANLSYPLEVPSADDSADVSIADEAALIALAVAVKNSVTSLRESARSAKAAVRAATTKAEAIAALDAYKGA